MCRYFRESVLYKGWPPRRAGVILKCDADGHEPGCGGLLKSCDKEYKVCPLAVMQGPEAFCRHVREVRDCKGDIDWCDLPTSEQAQRG